MGNSISWLNCLKINSTNYINNETNTEVINKISVPDFSQDAYENWK